MLLNLVIESLIRGLYNDGYNFVKRKVELNYNGSERRINGKEGRRGRKEGRKESFFFYI